MSPTVTLTANQQRDLLAGAIECRQYLSAFMVLLDPAHAKSHSVHEMMTLLASVHQRLGELACATSSILRDAISTTKEAQP